MKFIGILWNPMNSLREEAIEDIKRYATIEDTICVDLKDRYLDFLEDIYPFDGIHKDIHIFKASTMIDKYESNEICILFLELEDSEKEFCDRKHTYIYRNVENIKSFIRNKYKNRIKGYSFDNVFHMTDDKNEYLYTLGVIYKYVKVESLKLKKRGEL